MKEAVEQQISVLGEHRLGMKLEADHGVADVLHRHDLAVFGGGGDAQLGRHVVSRNHQ